MTIGEIARCLYKARWADATEYKQALAAFARLSNDDKEKVIVAGAKYA